MEEEKGLEGKKKLENIQPLYFPYILVKEWVMN
jgi:hypothetical protein